MAEDILQTAYAKVLSGRASFGHRSNFKTWLFAVIRRTGQEVHRREAIRRLFLGRLRDFAELSTQILSPADEADRDGTAARLRHHTSALPRRQNEVLILVFYHDLTLAETAETLGISLGSVRRHYERGKANLRKCLHNDRREHHPAWSPQLKPESAE